MSPTNLFEQVVTSDNDANSSEGPTASTTTVPRDFTRTQILSLFEWAEKELHSNTASFINHQNN